MVTPFAEGAVLRCARSAPKVDIFALTQGQSVLVLTPHPDDESLGCGAAIAAASQCGFSVTVVCLTDGAGSHPRSRAFPPEKLAALRFEELSTAVGILSERQADVWTLQLPDQGVTAQALMENDILAKLCRLIDDRNIGALWTTWEGDPHVDHQAAADIAKKLAECRPQIAQWKFPVWGRFVEQDISRGETIHTFDAVPYAALKRKAISAHASQMAALIDDDPSGFTMDAQVQQHFLDFPELFIRSAGK